MNCVLCEEELGDVKVGYGDGAGQRFVHPACYHSPVALRARVEHLHALVESQAREATALEERLERESVARESAEAHVEALKSIIESGGEP
jgi:hypothetical protein